MRKKRLFCYCIAALFSLASFARADEVLYDPQAEKPEKQTQQVSPSEDDILRKQQLSATPAKTKQEPQYERMLAERQDLFEQVFLSHLANGRSADLAKMSELYKTVPAEKRDDSLIEWAEAMLLAEKSLNQSVRAYRSLAAKFPENDFIRFQLANFLFANQEFDAAKGQFEKLRSSPNVNQQDIEIFDKFLQSIAKKDKWNVSMGMQFLNDKNLTELADKGTSMTLANGATITQSTPKEKGTGLRVNIGVEKQWSLDNGRFITLESDVNNKYYWNNKGFNELNGYLGTGYGYADARLNLKATPYLSKRWYAGGSSEGKQRLKSYTHNYGLSLSGSYWITPSLKYSANYNYSYEKYHNQNYKKRYNGAFNTLGNSILYLNGPKQYWGGGVDYSRRSAKEKSSSYNRTGVRLFWGQEWPLGLSTSTSLGFAKRHYQKAGLLGIKQKNNEYSTNVSLWHKAVHYAGFTPRLTFNYQKIKSNIPIFSYDKKQMFMEVEKTF